MSKSQLDSAKKTKYDEFYTRMCDIHEELQHYQSQFKDKVVYCNCDNPNQSEFWEFFSIKFHEYGLKKLVATYKGSPYKYIKDYSGVKEIFTGGDGDFRSNECILQGADIIVTNPPFSLCREYIAQLMEYKKKFLILAPMSCFGYKEIFPLFANNSIWVGTRSLNKDIYFCISEEHKSWLLANKKQGSAYAVMDDEVMARFAMVSWVTNLNSDKKRKPITLTAKYNEKTYLKYDNYDAININRLNKIPCDYYGVMGVPITFLGKYCPEQFEIVGFRKGNDGKDLKIGNKDLFSRILIRRKT